MVRRQIGVPTRIGRTLPPAAQALLKALEWDARHPRAARPTLQQPPGYRAGAREHPPSPKGRNASAAGIVSISL